MVYQNQEYNKGWNGTDHQFYHALCTGNDSNVFHKYDLGGNAALSECGY